MYVNLVMVSGRISILRIPDSVVLSERRIRLDITCRRRSLWMGWSTRVRGEFIIFIIWYLCDV